MEEEKKSNLVKESDVCQLWEPAAEAAIAMLHECWFCKWSDFREDASEYKDVGQCFYSGKEPRKIRREGSGPMEEINC